MRALRRTLALGAFFALAVVLAACGDSVPGNSVAKVNDQTIKQSTFDHWMKVAAVSAAAQSNPSATSAPKVAVPSKADDFKSCVADKKKSAGAPAKGQKPTSDAQYKQQCEQQFNQLKDQVLSFLIRATWLDQEAAKQHVKVTDQDVQKQLDQAKKQAFPNPSDYSKYLTRSGLTNADVLFQQRSQLLEQKITQAVTKGKDKVTDQQITDYYNKNKSKFATPERRDLRIVLTKDKATAQKAKQALQSGQSWNAVAKKYSIDQASKTNGGKLAGVAKGQQEKALDDAVFKAPKNKLEGPVKTQFGYYVFDVTNVKPAKQQSLQDSKKSITEILKSDNQRKALDTFGKDYRNRYKDATECRSGYVTDDCKNAPKKSSSTSSTSTGAATTTTSSGQ
jgi:parvulin-like peptidyl-prolyl isomerase